MLEAILKVDLASLNRRNGGKTTCVGDSVGGNYHTMHFGNDKRWRTRDDKQPVSVSYLLARETTKEFAVLVGNHIEKDLYQVNFIW